MKEAIIYLLAITAAEMVIVFVQPLWGIVIHIAILVTVIMRSARTADKSQRQLVLSLALVPLTRIMDLSIGMTIIGGDPRRGVPAVYGPLLLAALVVARILGYSRSEIGLNLKSLPFQLGVASSGLLFGWLEYLILRPEVGWITHFTWSEVVPMVLILMVFTGFGEELVYRGVLQRSATESFGGWRGILYVSLLFAVVHLIHYQAGELTRVIMDVAFVFGVAMFFGWVVKKTGSLLGVILAHGITNVMLFVVLPLLLAPIK